jgi:hypothetical protein
MSYYFPFPSLSVNLPHFRRTYRCSAPETTPPGTSFHLCHSEECVKPPRGETYGDSFTVEGQGENTEGVVTFSTAGDQYPLEWASPEECVNPSKGECSGSEVGELIGTCMTKIDSQFQSPTSSSPSPLQPLAESDQTSSLATHSPLPPSEPVSLSLVAGECGVGWGECEGLGCCRGHAPTWGKWD